MSAIKWIDHLIDFFVILGADVGAAYFAIKIFESRSADRARTEQSLSILYQLATRMRDFAWVRRARITPNNQMEERVENDLTENDRAFENIKDDFLFWNFKTVKIFREHYNKIRIQKAAIHNAQPAGELRVKMDTLIEELDSLKRDIEAELKPKKLWWQVYK
jgi:hypothetical protein